MAEDDEARANVTPGRTRTKRNKSAPAKKAKARAARSRKAAPRTASDPTAARAAKLAINLIDFEKTTFDSAATLFAALNDRSEKAVCRAVSNASWMPKEGQKLVEEWQRTLRNSLKDFTKSVDKSFDLLSNYLARFQAEAAKGKK